MPKLTLAYFAFIPLLLLTLWCGETDSSFIDNRSFTDNRETRMMAGADVVQDRVPGVELLRIFTKLRMKSRVAKSNQRLTDEIRAKYECDNGPKAEWLQKLAKDFNDKCDLDFFGKYVEYDFARKFSGKQVEISSVSNPENFMCKVERSNYGPWTKVFEFRPRQGDVDLSCRFEIESVKDQDQDPRPKIRIKHILSGEYINGVIDQVGRRKIGRLVLGSNQANGKGQPISQFDIEMNSLNTKDPNSDVIKLYDSRFEKGCFFKPVKFRRKYRIEAEHNPFICYQRNSDLFQMKVIKK